MANIHISNLGDTVTVSNVPTVSGSATYGFIPSNFRTFLAGTGTASVTGNLFKTTSGTTLGDYGVIRSFRSVNYKIGQGCKFQMNAYFGTPLALTWSGVGAFNVGDEVSFGYNGLTFGIWHRYHGKAEIRDLQITAGATGAETATVTINSVAYACPVTSGSVQLNAKEIADYLNANATGLEAEQIDDTVRIDFTSDGAKSGTYSISSTGTCAGTFSQVTAGVTKTSDHIAQSDWDNTYAGFDPSKGNNYMIYMENGFGNIEFFIEDDYGIYKKVHTINWTNRNTQTNLYNPSLHVGLYCYSVGATSAVDVYASTVSGSVFGDVKETRNPRGTENTKSIDTTLTNIMTIRNSRTYNNTANQAEIEPKFLTLANDGTKSAIFQLRGNATVAGNSNFQTLGTNLISQKDTAGTTVTEDGRLLCSFTVAKASSIIVDLTALRIRIPPSLRLVIAGKMASGASADLSASLTWYEDI